MTETDLLRSLHSTEHTFVERKTVGDSRDWVKTVVAFANSLETSQEGILFIGATDKGEIESNSASLDKLQKTFSEKMQMAYPPVYYTTKIIADSGRECLAVVVPGSFAKPHYAGPLYLRDGSQTVIATDAQHDSLLASRLGKTRALQQWIGKSITLRIISRRQGMGYALDQTEHDATALACNQFYLTLKFNNRIWSYPLSRLDIAFDHVRDRLEIELSPPQV
jgi:schlafen family protein